MGNGTTMNGGLFRALRDGGIEEKAATRAAEAVPPLETIATKAELQTEIQGVRAAIPAAETLADKAEVEVLKAESDTTKGILKQILARMDDMDKRMDKRQGDIEKRLGAIEKEMTDIKASARSDRKLLYLLLSTNLTAVLGLLSLVGFAIKVVFFG